MLLDRLGLPYRVQVPAIDEEPQPGESPPATALRLAAAKACTVALSAPDALVIGSDQVAVLDATVLGKPGSHAAAAQQLQAMSGRTVIFHTAVSLLHAPSGRLQSAVVPTTVSMRVLDAAQIERYLQRDRPYDCAGSAKIEALGIALVERVHSDDPTALIGLPLITLVSQLRSEGVDLP